MEPDPEEEEPEITENEDEDEEDTVEEDGSTSSEVSRKHGINHSSKRKKVAVVIVHMSF